MRAGIVAVMVCGISTAAMAGQAPVAPPAEPTPEALVRQWFERWNALTEATDTHDALAALYAPDALHLAGPSPDQRGTTTFRGPDGVRALAARVGASEFRRTWRIDTETARESTAQLIHVAAGPWGGASVAVQLVAVSTDRATGKRYAVPGAAFFQVEGTTFRRVRIYLGEGERAEVEPEPTRRRP